MPDGITDLGREAEVLNEGYVPTEVATAMALAAVLRASYALQQTRTLRANEMIQTEVINLAGIRGSCNAGPTWH